VGEKVAKLDVLLAIRAEFRPHLGDPGGRCNQATVDEHQAGECGHRLGRRPHVDDGVGSPRPSSRRVGVPTPHVDDGFTVDVYRDGRAEFLPVGDGLVERVGDPLKSRVAVPVNGAHRTIMRRSGAARS
jgi:hypothetical protein